MHVWCFCTQPNYLSMQEGYFLTWPSLAWLQKYHDLWGRGKFPHSKSTSGVCIFYHFPSNILHVCFTGRICKASLFARPSQRDDGGPFLHNLSNFPHKWSGQHFETINIGKFNRTRKNLRIWHNGGCLINTWNCLFRLRDKLCKIAHWIEILGCKKSLDLMAFLKRGEVLTLRSCSGRTS